MLRGEKTERPMDRGCFFTESDALHVDTICECECDCGHRWSQKTTHSAVPNSVLEEDWGTIGYKSMCGRTNSAAPRDCRVECLLVACKIGHAFAASTRRAEASNTFKE